MPMNVKHLLLIFMILLFIKPLFAQEFRKSDRLLIKTSSNDLDVVFLESFDHMMDLKDILKDRINENERTFDRLSVEIEYNQENAMLLKGGLRKNGVDHRHVFKPTLQLNFDKFGLPIGTLFVQGLGVIEDPAVNQGNSLMGDLHVYSNILGENRFQFFEFLLKNRFELSATQDLSIEVGRIDGNAHFAVSLHEHSFLSGSSGYSPAIPFQSYPEVGWGTQIFYDIALSKDQNNQTDKELELAFAIFDGSNTDIRGIPTGDRFWASPGFLSGKSWFILSQNRFAWTSEYAGDLSVGVWHHTGDFQTEHYQKLVHGTSGFYFTFDQNLLKWNNQIVKSSDQSEKTVGTELNLGIQASFAKAEALDTPRHISVALLIKDLFPVAYSEVELGTSASQLQVNALKPEYLIETMIRGPMGFLNHQAEMGLDLKLVLCYTYVKNPGGGIYPDAHLGIMRIEAKFARAEEN